MLSISKIVSLSYYESLAKDDYYQQGQEPPGIWRGRLVEQFALAGAAAGEEYRRIFSGVDPRNGQPLVQGAGQGHRSGWDFCYSAPKSVSVIWSQADPTLRHQIEQAQATAVEAARSFMETQLITRRGKAGCIFEQPASCLWADFEHSTSRAQDPQLHTHSLLVNVCKRDDGSYGTIEPSNAFRAKLAAGAIYRAELANSLKQLGFAIERDGDSFRVAGGDVLQSLEKIFSKRREAIEEAMAQKGVTSAKAAEVATLNSREKKEHQSREVLFREWQQLGDEYNFNMQDVYSAEATQLPPADSPEKIFRDLTSHQSTFHARDLIRVLATEGQGRNSVEDVLEHARNLLNSNEIIPLHGPDGTLRYTTQEMIEIEQGILQTSKRRQNEHSHPVTSESIAIAQRSRSLTEEQKTAFCHVVEHAGGITCIQGVAGAGKSYLLGACREAWQHDGYELIGAALAGKAAEGLEEGSGIKSQTIHSLIAELEQGQRCLSSKTIVVIDEAGMVGSRQMAQLLQLAETAGAKVVLVGDTRQLQPVEAGAAFRVVQEQVGAAHLSEIRRQRKAWAVQAVHDFAAGRSLEGLIAYHEHGLVHIASERSHAMSQLVGDWWNERDAERPGESLMIAATRSDVAQLNKMARDKMHETGNLGATVKICREDSTKIEIAEGDRILFTKNSRHLGVKNGHLATVEMITASPVGTGVRIRARLDNNRQVIFDSSKYSEVDYGYSVTCHKAQGVTVDRTYLLGAETMMSRELTYVQLSRHRDEAKIYLSSDGDSHEVDIINTTARKMGLSKQAESATDYEQTI